MINKQSILKSDEYRFLRTNPYLGGNIILLGYGGSHAYGTNNEDSDIDIRGITLNPIDTLFGNGEFEQVVDKDTDTTIYGLNKMIKLLLQCNPNTIEILGLKPEHYLIKNKHGRKLLDNKKIFLSKKATYTFGSYANSQLRRLQNALARDTYPQAEKEQHILGSISHAMNDIVSKYHTIGNEVIHYDFTNDNGKMIHAMREYNETMKNVEDKFSAFENGAIKLYPDVAENPNFDTEIFCDVYLHHYPVRDYRNIWNEINTIVKDYDKLGKRNTKKDDNHLNKHAMHLIRLYIMCLDILERQEIITYREKEHDLLMDIRSGGYQKEGGGFRAEFFEMVDEYERKLKYASENTALPDAPDYEAANELLITINRNHYLDEY